MRRAAPAIALFFLSPLVAEFLLGDFTILQLPYLFLLAPAYGGAAVLIREVSRRAGSVTRTVFPALVSRSRRPASGHRK
jgi:hypothetical protein